jgi:hypothetical protein
MLLGSNAFSIVLFDASLLQITIEFSHSNMVAHRLCYYPCPVVIDNELLVEEPILDVFDVFVEHRDLLRLRTPVRFDYDPINAQVGHPVSHAHLQVESCRCPVVAPIGIGVFIKFIFANFYAEVWKSNSFIREWPADLSSRTIRQDESELLHFSCSRPFPR